MTRKTTRSARRNGTGKIVMIYPFGVLALGVLVNVFAVRVDPLVIAPPTIESVHAVVAASVLLVINHTWLMTATELTRLRFGMYATPEEWNRNERTIRDVSIEAIGELERHHNAHRNTTENVVYFVMLVSAFVAVSPTTAATWVWIIGFPVARLGYTYSYLFGKDGLRGLFMSLGLLATYGLLSYLVIGLLT